MDSKTEYQQDPCKELASCKLMNLFYTLDLFLSFSHPAEKHYTINLVRIPTKIQSTPAILAPNFAFSCSP